MGTRRGSTLVEVLVAGAILALLTLALFEGIVVAGRISRANAEILEAEGVAWDAVWAAFNEDYPRLLSEAAYASSAAPARTVTLKSSAAPLLSSYDTRPVLTLTLSRLPLTTNTETDKRENFVAISADVEWGPGGRRKLLSDCLPDAGEPPVMVLRSPLSRVATY